MSEATITEKRVLPFKSYVDPDMGACVEDAHGRLVAAFGFHPDRSPANDEAGLVCAAVNCHQDLLDAAEMLWTVVANASSGDWSKQNHDWQVAA